MTQSNAATEGEMLHISADEIPIGATVYVCDPETSLPAEDDGGRLPPLKCMVGGIPIRGKLYPIDHIRQTPSGTVTATGFDVDGVLPGVSFVPTVVYSPETAPPETEFAVFRNGVRLRHEKTNGGPDSWYNARVYKMPDGRFISVGWISRRLMELPPDVQLVPTSEIGEGKPPG